MVEVIINGTSYLVPLEVGRTIASLQDECDDLRARVALHQIDQDLEAGRAIILH